MNQLGKISLFFVSVIHAVKQIFFYSGIFGVIHMLQLIAFSHVVFKANQLFSKAVILKIWKLQSWLQLLCNWNQHL